jgi:hypothetical protein
MDYFGLWGVFFHRARPTLTLHRKALVLNKLSMLKKKATSQALVPVEIVERRILLIRGHKVILDADLAALHGELKFAATR